MPRSISHSSRVKAVSKAVIGLATAAALLAAPLPLLAAEGKAPRKEAPPPLPPAAARLWVTAPAPTGTWTLRIDNEGAVPLRVPADATLLRFELVKPLDSKGKRTKKYTCAAPGALRPGAFPEKRALVLAPGESYVETFDPRLFCFGKDAEALSGGVLVRARFGWDPPRKGTKKPPEPPFAVETAEAEPTAAALRELNAPTMILSYGSAKLAGGAEAAPADKVAPEKPVEDKASADKASADKASADKASADKASADKAAENKPAPDKAATDKAPPPDPGAPRLAVSAGAMSDAASLRSATVSVTAKNAGKRPLTAVLRSRSISFDIEGPDGKVACPEAPTEHTIPRDNFQSIKPGGAASFAVLLGEVCPRGVLTRPGLYAVTPSVHATETGEAYGLSAYTGVARSESATTLRLASGPEPYHKAPPKAVSTASLAPKAEE